MRIISAKGFPVVKKRSQVLKRILKTEGETEMHTPVGLILHQAKLEGSGESA